MNTPNPNPPEDTTPDGYTMPEVVPFVLPLFYYEPRHPLFNRAERRRHEQFLIANARRRIRTHTHQLATKLQEKKVDPIPSV